MNCEEFEAIGLSVQFEANASAADRMAAREHSSTCSRCASLQDAWLAAKLELSALSEATGSRETPGRVEMRLRQEFRARHRTAPARRAAVIAAWALATAALLVAAISWRNWQIARQGETAKERVAVLNAQPQAGQNDVYAARVSVDDGGEFTLLPGNVDADPEDAAIWRVRMQRSALGSLGFPVSEERAGEWIQVDLLVGDDGLPQGVRLAQ